MQCTHELSLLHSALLQEGMGRARREEAPEDMAGSFQLLLFGGLLSRAFSSHVPTILLRQSDRGKAEASEQALAPREGRTGWDLWRVMELGWASH